MQQVWSDISLKILIHLTGESENITKNSNTIQDEFQRGLLTNMRIPKIDPFVVAAEGNTVVENIEDLIKVCNEQISTTHAEIERYKKSTNFCISRLLESV